MIIQDYPEQVLCIWVIFTCALIINTMMKDIVNNNYKLAILKIVWVFIGFTGIILSMLQITTI